MNNVRSLPVQHYMDGERVVKDESVAAETLIHITVNGETLVNLLGSPENSDELAKGHLMTQFNVDFNDIVSVDTTLVNGAVEVAVSTRGQTVLAQRWDCDHVVRCMRSRPTGCVNKRGAVGSESDHHV